MINQHMTIAEAVKDNPDIIKLLSEYGIDYCCESSKKLLDLTKVKNLDPDEFIKQLNNVHESERNLSFKEALKLYQPEDKKKLIAYIIKHHHRVEEKLLAEIGEYLPILLRVHYEEHADELSRLYKKFSQFNAELTVHMTREERSEFQLMLDGEEYDRATLISEHEIIGTLLHDLKRVTNDFTPPPDCCQTYELTFAKLKELYMDIHQHFFLENQVLFV
ncbi:MAG: DUF542 domain-containing protein [Eubacteriales bacterium]|nr:DUF542 domain-containing protein [Eubacteriales bacterium]MDD4324350.1 DUF542 domain-containing protein [Eubacteriales bacterium]MDD4541590.1 DUF542 domain-containing protein [Eubacteriales bacterium]